MWGLRGLPIRRLLRLRMFPTHVGIARERCGALCQCGDVPYACGDCACGATRSERSLGCSLRMWGLRDREIVRPSRGRMFPTHVGIARTDATGASGRADVPYACGDCAGPYVSTIGYEECSLRMWGLRVIAHVGIFHGEMFPTHVGIARNQLENKTNHRNVPYACGDCAKPRRKAALSVPCSLRMWGLRDFQPIVRVGDGMFPTHVGIARCRFCAKRQHGDVPYACGDCAPSTATTPTGVPCSLRMWGLRGAWSAYRGIRRMFPTHVGIAAPDRRLTAPHLCSLRMWGLRAENRSFGCADIMFPTHVGIARRAGCLRSCARHVPYACGDCARSTS